MVGTLIEKEAVGWKPPQGLTVEVAWSTAEEIPIKMGK
jgi:hypothetical protein